MHLFRLVKRHWDACIQAEAVALKDRDLLSSLSTLLEAYITLTTGIITLQIILFIFCKMQCANI